MKHINNIQANQIFPKPERVECFARDEKGEPTDKSMGEGYIYTPAAYGSKHKQQHQERIQSRVEQRGKDKPKFTRPSHGYSL